MLSTLSRRVFLQSLLAGSTAKALPAMAPSPAGSIDPPLATVLRTRYNPTLQHTINDVHVTFSGRTYTAGFLTFYEQTGDVDRWGYPTSELLMEEPASLTQYYQRGIVDFHYRPDLGAYVLERRLVWDDLGGLRAGPGNDQGVEPPPAHPLGVVVGPWGHSVSNVLPDGTYIGFLSFFQQVGGVRSLGFPKTEARLDTGAPGQLHLPGATPGFIRQYFQAAVLEFHPGATPPVEPALLGDMVRDKRYPANRWQSIAAFQPQTSLSAGEWLTLSGPAAPTGTQPAPRLAIAVHPSAVVQGRSFICDIAAPSGLAVSATLDGHPLLFAPTATGYWAVGGFDPIAAPGAHQARLTARNSQGALVQQADISIPVLAGYFPTLHVAVVLPPSKLPLLNRSLEQAEDAFLAPFFLQFTPHQLWSGLFIYPVSNFVITTGFGEREIFAGRRGVSWHGGLDLAVPEGTPIYAANSGTVILARPMEVRGNMTILDHGMGVCSAYLHQSRFAVQEGQTVAKGQLLGYVGATGLATGPHVHWEIRVHNVHVDPAQWTRRTFGP